MARTCATISSTEKGFVRVPKTDSSCASPIVLAIWRYVESKPLIRIIGMIDLRLDISRISSIPSISGITMSVITARIASSDKRLRACRRRDEWRVTSYLDSVPDQFGKFDFIVDDQNNVAQSTSLLLTCIGRPGSGAYSLSCNQISSWSGGIGLAQ